MSALRARTLGDRLASARLAGWLIAAMIGFSMLSFVIPQRLQLTKAQWTDFEQTVPTIAAVTEATGLDSLFTSIPMLALVGLLAVNIVACTWRRIRRRTGVVASASFRALVERPLEEGEDATVLLDRTRRQLDASGWRTTVAATAVVGVKGRAGFWGSVLLHTAMLVIAAGGILTALSSFGGTLVLTEGQTLPDAPASYTAITREPRIGEGYTGAAITLEGMTFGYDGDVTVRVVAAMRADTAAGLTVRHDTRVNYPFIADGKQYLLRDSGLAADVTVSTLEGPRRIVLSLAEKTPLGWQDEVPLADGATLRMRVSPVPLEDGAEMPADSLPAVDPRLSIQVVDASGAASQTRVGGIGQTLETGGVQVTFHAAPVWSSFLARKDDGRWVTYTGLWACVIGALVRFLVPERRVAFAVRGHDLEQTLAIGYRARPWVGIVVPGDRGITERLLEPVNTGDRDA